MNISMPGHQMDAGDVHQQICTLGGKEVIVDREGFLWHPEDWTEGVAKDIAAECGIEELSAIQWRAVRFIREYYFYHGRAPLNRDLKAALEVSLLELEGLFPGGIRRGAHRVAGLPNPKTCSG